MPKLRSGSEEKPNFKKEEFKATLERKLREIPRRKQ